MEVVRLPSARLLPGQDVLSWSAASVPAWKGLLGSAVCVPVPLAWVEVPSARWALHVLLAQSDLTHSLAMHCCQGSCASPAI